MTNNNNNNNEASSSLRIKKLSDKAILPTRGSEWSAGLDLYAAEPKTIPPQGRAVVRTDLCIACPKGTYGRIAPRSGLTVKHGIDVGAGVVDADYRGPVGVVLFNLGDKDFQIKEGDRIAQLVLEQIVMAPIVEVGQDEEMDVTERGAGGFGSTGVSSSSSSSSSLAKKQKLDGNDMEEDPPQPPKVSPIK
ncbi:unnamed protein product [Cylindrotheca closterium]|uniref:Deoxyuridine 5'-triphosphate nucleotidohydrolase n=1 Tax=Cylindrotheca closterium TaxID=2856 RepID=A0AAD2FKN4_9STRA|nr:unnamed protein product [Cylindrotheca closterium]CAJ1937978.1 unnamed protein product [Cylindrotheca closterium]